MKADLHVHSKYSDGSYSIEEIFSLFENKLDLISITDHDSIDAYYYLENLENINDFNNLDILRGVELTTYYKSHEVHILGYGFKELDLLSSYLKTLQNDRLNRGKEIVSRLQKSGININIDFNNINSIGLPHIADALIDAGYSKSRKDAFKKYLYESSPFRVKKNTYGLQEVVEIINKAGGIPVLAHPRELDRSIWLDSSLLDSVEGIEVYHPSNVGYEPTLLRKAFEHKLLVTGGSDFHSKHDKNKIGNVYVEINRSDFFD